MAASKVLKAPPNQGPRARKLWHAAVAAKTLNGAELVLLEEACRVTDRLDHFAKLIDGDKRQWARVRFIDQVEEYELVIDSAVSEARQHAAALRQLIVALDLPPAEDEGKAKEANPLDALAARRAARIAGASAS